MQEIEKPIRILNILESLGTGGAQTMMFELSNGLNKYFGDKCTSIVAGSKKNSSSVVTQHKLLETYGIPLLRISYGDLDNYCKKEAIDIVVHHRVSISKPVRSFINKKVAYIVVSHTAADLGNIRHFYPIADYIVCVCNRILICSPKTKDANSKKMPVILNGIENDFVADIQPAKLRGGFNSGRCHRLVPTKFNTDSLGFFEKNKSKLPSHVHYLMGAGNKSLPIAAQNKTSVQYLGEVNDRNVKYSYLKALDVYFYEIFANEGASIAVLEALACGVPVICLKKGGIKELVRNGINGYIEPDRQHMFRRMIELSKKKEELAALKASTLKDFNARLHIKRCAQQYVELFEKTMRKKCHE